MHLVFSKEIRAAAAAALRKARQDAPYETRDSLSLSMLDDFGRVAKSNRKQSRADLREAFPDEISTANLAALATGALGFSLISSTHEQDADRVEILPPQFIAESERPDPNHLIGSHLTAISNKTLAIVNLVESGFEMAARPLIRTLQEFCCLSLIIASDQEKARDHFAAQKTEEEKKVFYKHFSPRKLNRAVSDLEERVGFSDGAFEKHRAEVHSYYTTSVHATFGFGSLSGYVSSVREDDWVAYALFGRASTGSRNTLFMASVTAWHYLELLKLVVTEVHGYQIPTHNDLMASGFGFADALGKSLQILLRTRQDRTSSVLNSA